MSVIANAAIVADPQAFRVAREERLSEAEDSKARPGDVALSLGNGRCLADVTVASPFGAAGQKFTRIAGNPAAAASAAYDRKLAKWHSLLQNHVQDGDRVDSSFQPLAVTALGSWDERSLAWLRKFSDVCAAASAIDKGSAFSNLMTLLSVALWRGNSRLLRSLHETALRLEENIPDD